MTALRMFRGGRDVKAPILYRISSVLLLLLAAGHTVGFRWNNPERGADAVLGSMRAVHFDAQGFTRTYWDFFSAFGFFFSASLLFAAALAWLLSRLSTETLARVRSIAWALAIFFVAVTALSWRYAFTTPIIWKKLARRHSERPTKNSACCHRRPASLRPVRALTVREVGTLSDFDDIAVRIADVAADLAVLGYRRRDELGSSTFP
jgi:hypothetical protein